MAQGPSGGISEADRLSMLKPVGSEGNDIKPPIVTKALPNSQGIDYYNTQGFTSGMIMRYSQARSWLDGILKYITREATPVHANEATPTIAAASGGEGGSYGDSGGGGVSAGAPIEAAVSNFNFADFAAQGGAYASSMVSMSYEALGSLMPSMTPSRGMGSGIEMA